MHGHLYHKGNDFTIKYPTSALKKNTNRGADRIAPPHWPEKLRSEGGATCTEVSNGHSGRYLSGTNAGSDNKKHEGTSRYRKHHANKILDCHKILRNNKIPQQFNILHPRI